MTLITLIIESFLSSEQITLTLSVQRPYLLTYSYDIVLLYSLGCIHPIPTCQTLITLITLVTESFLTIWTDNVQLPVNPCKSRYLAINVICTTVLSLNIQFLSGVPDYFDRNKILSGYDLSHYQVPHCIRVLFYFVWFVFIHHNFQFYFKLCTYRNILDIYL